MRITHNSLLLEYVFVSSAKAITYTIIMYDRLYNIPIPSCHLVDTLNSPTDLIGGQPNDANSITVKCISGRR